MVNIPVLRWGRPYTSLEVDNVIHFITGETLAQAIARSKSPAVKALCYPGLENHPAHALARAQMN